MVRWVSIRTNFTDEISTKVFFLSAGTGACHAPVFAGRGKEKNAVSGCSISTKGVRDSRTPMPRNGVPGTDKKRSQNAQPQNDILCSKGAWGRCPQQADGRKCECVLTLALLAGFVCGYPHALLASLIPNSG